MKNSDYRMQKGNISDTNHLGSFKAEQKLDVEEESYENSNKRPYDCIRNPLCRDWALNNPEMFTRFVLGFVIGINKKV